MAFANPLPSLAPMDLLIGIFGAVFIRLIVYVKGKNAKKYRKGVDVYKRQAAEGVKCVRERGGQCRPT